MKFLVWTEEGNCRRSITQNKTVTHLMIVMHVQTFSTISLLRLHEWSERATANQHSSNMPTMPKITIGIEGTMLLRSTKPHKATGPDSVSARIPKEAAEELAPVLTLIFQLSLDKGTVPDDGKKANVVPVFKKGDRSTPLNYRSISLTSICSKLMEHIIHSNIMKHLHSHNILAENQNRFRKRRYCESQLNITIGDLANALNNKEQVDVSSFTTLRKRLTRFPISDYCRRSKSVVSMETYWNG